MLDHDVIDGNLSICDFRSDRNEVARNRILVAKMRKSPEEKQVGKSGHIRDTQSEFITREQWATLLSKKDKEFGLYRIGK